MCLEPVRKHIARFFTVHIAVASESPDGQGLINQQQPEDPRIDPSGVYGRVSGRFAYHRPWRRAIAQTSMMLRGEEATPVLGVRSREPSPPFLVGDALKGLSQTGRLE
jgi:hypothetical protein